MIRITITGDKILFVFGSLYLLSVIGTIAIFIFDPSKAYVLELIKILLSPQVLAAIIALLAGKTFGKDVAEMIQRIHK